MALSWMSRMLKKMSRPVSRSGRKQFRSPRPTRPQIEALEDRLTPSILFTPQNGSENATKAGGTVLGSSSDVPIYLTFWGSYWATSAGQAYANQIEASINPMFLNSPYLNSLHQYGVQHRAFLTQTIIDPTDPVNGFGSSDDIAAAFYGTNHGMPKDDNGIYLAITKPGIKCAVNSDGTQDEGYHGYSTYQDSGKTRPFNYGWIGTDIDATLDYVTRIISHEVVETMTDPRGDAWQVDPRNTSQWNEIADNEAQSYHYRVNGYLVQAYWSQSDGAFKVDDGNSQNFYVNNGELTINGDQFGYGSNDVDSSVSG